MNYFLMVPLLASVAGSLLTSQETPRKAGATLATAESQQHDATRQKASQLIGCAITNTKKESLGEIQDIVLDNGNHKIAYVVVAFGGFLGMGEKYFAMPWRLIELQRNGKDEAPVAILGLDRETLKAAPGFDKSQWPDMASTTWAKQVDDYYTTRNEKVRPAGTTEPKGGAADGTRGVDRPPASLTFVHRRLSQLIGMAVVDTKNKALADVEDLVVDTEAATVDGVLLSFGGLLGMGESLALVPADALTLDSARQVFVFPCTTAGLEAMALKGGQLPELDNDKWLVDGRAMCAKATAGQVNLTGDAIAVDASGKRSVPFADSYDLAKVETIKGTVTTIGSVRIGDRNEERVRLRIQVSDDRDVIVYAAPATFEDQAMLAIVAGRAVEVTGSPAKYGSQTVLVAGSITVDGKTASLRDDKGAPTWTRK